VNFTVALRAVGTAGESIKTNGWRTSRRAATVVDKAFFALFFQMEDLFCVYFLSVTDGASLLGGSPGLSCCARLE
jgi:hypothetical protein